MLWCLLLIWAQGLRQASLLTSGAVSGRLVTSGNISAEEGGSVTLHCHLSSTTANVTQVNWFRQNQMLAVHDTALGWHINPTFENRVLPGPGLGLLLQLLTTNDTGEYFCTYHTFPDGIYQGTLFLEVLESSVAKHSAGFHMPWPGVVAPVVVICIAVIGVVALARKKKSLQIHSAESGLRSASSEQEYWSPAFHHSPETVSHTDTAPSNLYREQREVTYAELHDYFNVLSYRSLGNISFMAETG